MNIGNIGAGNLGTRLAKQLVRKSHGVTLSFGKNLTKPKDAAVSVGAHSVTPAEAAAVADVIVLATPWNVMADALKQIVGVPRRRILWDCTNALNPDMSGLVVGTTTSGGEEVAKPKCCTQLALSSVVCIPAFLSAGTIQKHAKSFQPRARGCRRSCRRWCLESRTLHGTCGYASRSTRLRSWFRLSHRFNAVARYFRASGEAGDAVNSGGAMAGHEVIVC